MPLRILLFKVDQHFLFCSTGLDPTGPLFTNMDTKYRLDPGDAAYVDVIHTDVRGFGTDKGAGHADFWPNGGNLQPGCENNLFRRYSL